MLLKEEFTFFKASMWLLKILLAAGFCYAALVIWPILLLLVGYHTGPRAHTPFPEAHQRAINTFVASEGFGIGRLGKRPDFWQEFSIVFENTSYRTAKIRLIGLTPEKGDRYFDSSYPPKKETLLKAEHRPLTSEESEAVTQLREGKPWTKFLVKPPPKNEYDATLRVIAPVFAQKSCLECHDVKEGALLGAFDYWLEPLPQRLQKTQEKNQTEPTPPKTSA